MESLKRLIEEGNKTSWGIEVQPTWDRVMFVSKEFLPLINFARKKIQSLLGLAECYAAMSFRERMDTEVLKPYEFLGGGGEGSVYKVPLKRGVNIALKLYGDDTRNGLLYFENLVKARKENRFDTLTPYLATEDYIFTDLIPDLPEFETFIALHPELENEVSQAILNVQVAAKIKDAGLSIGDSFDDEDGGHSEPVRPRPAKGRDKDSDIVKHVHIAKFEPAAKNLQERYRFFIYDMM